jgi:NADP-dependent 3-hydroxy acid dehydrogenase YdfG
MSRLTSKGVLITGGGSGIGLAAAKMLLQEGAKVAITGRDAAKLARAADGLQAGDRLVHFPADVSKPEQVEALVKDAVKALGRIDILLNNAGLNIPERAFRQLTLESWKNLLGSNLEGAFYCMKAVLPHMLERKEGLIINVNSISGKRASPLGGTAYAAAKFGLRALGMGLAAEEKDNGIRVANIYPGEVDTPILKHRPTPLTEEHRRTILQPEDVAAAIVFVATLPARVAIPELVIMPSKAVYL